MERIQRYSDDYSLSTWKFNEDGSGIFTLQGMTNTQKISFTLEKIEDSIIIDKHEWRKLTLELNNGLLIENNAFGNVVYKKQ